MVQTLGWRQSQPNAPEAPPQQRNGPARIFPTKAIRIISLAPDLSNNKSDDNTSADTASTGGFLWDPNHSHPPTDEVWRSQAGLLQLISMLRDEFGEDEEEEDDDDELGAFHGDEGGWEDEDDDDENDEHEHGNEPTHPHE